MLASPAATPPGLPRRLAIVFYDALVLLGVLFFATALLLPLNSGQAFSADQWYFTLYLVCVCFGYYAGFWVYGGQTLGLKAWGCRVVDKHGGPITWRQALVRFVCAALSWALLGGGFWMVLWQRQGLAWHDLVSGTRLVRVPAR